MEIETSTGVVDSSARAARQPDGKDGILGSFFSLTLGMIESGVRPPRLYGANR